LNDEKASTSGVNAKRLLIIAALAATWAALGADATVKTNAPARPVKGQPAAGTTNQAPAGRTLVKNWTVDELVPVVNKGLKGKRNFGQGQKLFTETSCSLCHHFGRDGGGVGPDLTGVSGTFSVRDLLENIIGPRKRTTR
jgi:mono/diheme cytochrome c family protein